MTFGTLGFKSFPVRRLSNSEYGLILMTVGTAGVFYRVGVTGFVAFFAIQFLMFADQREAGFIVVEVAFVFQGLERRLGMAFCTILPESVFMYILVAVGAGAECNSGETLKILVVFLFNRVTFDTGHIGVFAFQREFGFLMLEFWRRFKRIETVARFTIVRQGLLVVIGMAGISPAMYIPGTLVSKYRLTWGRSTPRLSVPIHSVMACVEQA